MRRKLQIQLRKEGSVRDWSHITKHTGFYSYTGLNPENVQRLINEKHIYTAENGRISITGLTTKNLCYVARGIHDVTKNVFRQGLSTIKELAASFGASNELKIAEVLAYRFVNLYYVMVIGVVVDNLM